MEILVNLLAGESFHPNMLFERNADLVAYFLSRHAAGGTGTSRVVAVEWTRRGEPMHEVGLCVEWTGHPSEWTRTFIRIANALEESQELVMPAAITMMALCLTAFGAAEAVGRVRPLPRGHSGDYWIRHPDHAELVQIETSGDYAGVDRDLRERVRLKTGQVLDWGHRAEGYVSVTMFEDTTDGRARSVFAHVTRSKPKTRKSKKGKSKIKGNHP